jgi:hypothetical protein
MATNPFSAAIDTPGAAAMSQAASAIGDLARNPDGKGLIRADGTIIQTERLLTARARYGKEALLTGETGDRGSPAYIKLLTSQPQYSEYLSGNTKRDVTFKGLVGPDSLVSKMSNPQEVGWATGYDKFLLTNVSCEMNEKVQISEVFGDSEVVYYFGRHPLIFSISGVLIDSPDNSWFVDWIKLYSDFLRGSQLARNYELVRIVLPNMEITGSISSFGWGQNSARDVDISFSMQFIAKVVTPIDATPDGMVASNELKFVNFSNVAGFSGQEAVNAFKDKVTGLSAVLSNPASSVKDKAAAFEAVGQGLGSSSGSSLIGAKNSINGFQKTIDGWSKSSENAFSAIERSAAFQTVTSSLEGIRTNLFSPIYGVLSSLTKLVSTTFNSANRLFNKLITPVRNILRDITKISQKAIALVNLVNSSIRGLGRNIKGQLKGTVSDFKTAVKTLKKARGTIASMPSSLGQSIGAMFSQGVLAENAPFLRTPTKLTFTSPSLKFTSTPDAQPVLSLSPKPSTKVALLQALGTYTPEGAATL